MPRHETKEEWQARMRSISVMGKRNSRPRERTIIRTDGVDAGKKAKVVTDERGSVITTSDNRQDVNICPETSVMPLAIMQGQEDF